MLKRNSNAMSKYFSSYCEKVGGNGGDEAEKSRQRTKKTSSVLRRQAHEQASPRPCPYFVKFNSQNHQGAPKTSKRAGWLKFRSQRSPRDSPPPCCQAIRFGGLQGLRERPLSKQRTL